MFILDLTPALLEGEGEKEKYRAQAPFEKWAKLQGKSPIKL